MLSITITTSTPTNFRRNGLLTWNAAKTRCIIDSQLTTNRAKTLCALNNLIMFEGGFAGIWLWVGSIWGVFRSGLGSVYCLPAMQHRKPMIRGMSQQVSMFLAICAGGGAGAWKLTRYNMDWSEHCKSYSVCVGAAGSLFCNNYKFGPSTRHLFLLSPGQCQRRKQCPIHLRSSAA